MSLTAFNFFSSYYNYYNYNTTLQNAPAFAFFPDIVCCCMIMFPLVWQIRQLRLSAAVDGKVEINLTKLTQYRNFYMAVVGYIYFTRIIVYLVGATVPFYLTW